MDRTLFTIPEASRSRTSDVLVSLIERSRDSDVTLRALIDRMGDRTFGILLILVSIFSVLPVISSIAGLLVMCLGVQMSVGRTKAWLPRFVLDRQLHSDSVVAALVFFEPKIRAIERCLRQRLHFTEAYIFDRLNGFIITILGVVILIPIPFTNLGPAIVVIIMGLGLIERDGVIQISAALLGMLVIAALCFLAY